MRKYGENVRAVGCDFDFGPTAAVTAFNEN